MPGKFGVIQINMIMIMIIRMIFMKVDRLDYHDDDHHCGPVG